MNGLGSFPLIFFIQGAFKNSRMIVDLALHGEHSLHKAKIIIFYFNFSF